MAASSFNKDCLDRIGAEICEKILNTPMKITDRGQDLIREMTKDMKMESIYEALLVVKHTLNRQVIKVLGVETAVGLNHHAAIRAKLHDLGATKTLKLVDMLERDEISDLSIGGAFVQYVRDGVQYKLRHGTCECCHCQIEIVHSRILEFDARHAAATHASNDQPTISLAQKLTKAGKIESICLEFGTAGNLNKVTCARLGSLSTSLMLCCSVAEAYVRLKELDVDVHVSSPEPPKPSKTGVIRLPLPVPKSNSDHPNIFLYKCHLRGLYRIVDTKPLTPKWSSDLNGYILTGSGDLVLNEDPVTDFDQLAESHPKFWMALVGYDLCQCERSTDWYVICHRDDDDPMVELFKHLYCSTLGIFNKTDWVLAK